jgi:UDP-glucose 4-epimerase
VPKTITTARNSAEEIGIMKALVTGGAGFIGSNIVNLLVEEGHSVAVLDNLSSGYRCNLDPSPSVRFVEGDIRDAGKLSEAMKDAEVVFHLAASVGNQRSIDNPIEDSEVNLIGTLRVLEEARKAGVRKIVFSSSAGIFGELKHLPIAEDHPAEPDSPYGASKLAAEKQCLVYSKLFKIEAMCLRYFNVYGRSQRYDAYGNVIPIFMHSLLKGEPLVIFGDGEQTRDFVNVRDVAQANYKAAMVRGISGAFNISSGKRISINELVRMLIEVSGRRPRVEHGPVRKGDVRHSLADISNARRAFGFSPTVELSEGLKDYFRWAEQEGI